VLFKFWFVGLGNLGFVGEKSIDRSSVPLGKFGYIGLEVELKSSK